MSGNDMLSKDSRLERQDQRSPRTTSEQQTHLQSIIPQSGMKHAIADGSRHSIFELKCPVLGRGPGISLVLIAKILAINKAGKWG